MSKDFRPDWVQSHFRNYEAVSLFIGIGVYEDGWFKVKGEGIYLVMKDRDYYTVTFWSNPEFQLPFFNVHERVGLKLGRYGFTIGEL